jgi:hypothetical protein
MSSRKIEWKRSVDGVLDSKDGRFHITPEWQGTSKAQYYVLLDTKTRKTDGGDTQRLCKEIAQHIVDIER